LIRVAAALVALALVAGGCGGGKETIKVSAAASLKRAFERYASDFDSAGVSFSFAGSDELAAQIREGAEPDVFAAANAKLPADLYADRLVERPVAFASNRLVIAVREDSSKVGSIADLARPGTRIAAGAAAVPIGSYTREVLERLPANLTQAIERNIRSNEPDVAGIVAKVAQGAVEAGFVYVTDVRAAAGELHAIPLPARLQPPITYSAAVVARAPHPEVARRFVQGLRHAAGTRALREAGFGSPAP
jgi:molybdate transport system substrate-binding protein